MSFDTEFNKIISETLLLQEARKDRYLDMFAGIFNSVDSDSLKREVAIAVKWAMDTLKTDDKIVWYLTWYRIKLVTFGILRFVDAVDSSKFSNDKKFNKIKAKYTKKISDELNIDVDRLYQLLSSDSVDNIKNYLNHFYSQDVNEFNDVEFNLSKTPQVAFRELRRIESDLYKDKVEATFTAEDGQTEFNIASDLEFDGLDISVYLKGKN